MSEFVPQVGIGLAFGGGLLSFFSPCVAPLIPGYISYISGVSLEGSTQRGRAETMRVFWACLLFVLGFSLVFILLGASASFVGALLDTYRRQLNVVAGALMVLMGLAVMGVLRAPFLFRELRFDPHGRALGAVGPVLLGMAFAFGWTPCIGPILAAILYYASLSETVGQGMLLLLVFSLGMGIPFLLTGLFFGRALGTMRWMQRHSRWISYASGGLLVLVGLAFLTNRIFFLSILAQKLYYTLFY
ncbi:MAG: cytochrome c biogenesis protein CcdA [Chloroflexi bacterium]|nr:cytochrome c biogenesis protein CcdA [Chloroflexota bacterium]